ncbi:NAD(P)H dehydrogenase (quinone) [Microdochium nivale]|nr:NAD(P)H dehydrogenase (quinone) [Microdochium nivale]
MPNIFITTATGAQGSALCRILLSDASSASNTWTVHSTTRDLSSPIAQELAALGVNFTEADWDAPTAVFESAMHGCTHMFLNLLPNIKTMSSELPWAEKLLGVASRVGIRHVVYAGAYMGELSRGDSSAAQSDATGDISILASNISTWKTSVEQAILTHNPPFATTTVLQSAWFTLNFLSPRVDMMFPALPTTRVMTSAFLPTTRIPLVDTRDIAQFAALVLHSPAEWNGKKVPVWNELLTIEEMLEQLGEAVSSVQAPSSLAAATKASNNEPPFRAEFLTDAQIAERKPTDLFVNVQLFMRDMSADAAALTGGGPAESYGIRQSTFREFLARESELVRQTYCRAQ